MGGDAPPQFPSPVVTPSSPDGEFRIDWKLRTQDPRPQSSGKVADYQSSRTKRELGCSTILKRAAHSRANIDLAPKPWVLIKPLRFLSSGLRRAADLGGLSFCLAGLS